VSNAFVNAQSSTGTCTVTAPTPTSGSTWNLCSLSVSYAGGVMGPNGKLTVYDGAIGGTVLFAVFLDAPGNFLIGSVGKIQDIPLPKSPQGVPGLQASPGNAMNIQVTGTGNNVVSINARFSDGVP
jgi:hypothetical protein